MKVWARRYIRAYKNATGLVDTEKGSSKLLDKHDQPVTAAALGANIVSETDQAKAVRSYLKKHGGILLIEAHDIPSINTPTGNDHKERLLLFDRGVEGGMTRTTAEQYLDVDGATLLTQWTRQFNMAWNTQWNPGTLTQVAPPPLVSNPRTPLFMSGECW